MIHQWIFSVVVFIIAGPTIGFTISQVVTSTSFLTFFRKKYDFILVYSRLRAICKDEIRQELDSIEDRTNFSRSTEIILTIIGILTVFQDLFDITNQSVPLVDSNNFTLRDGLVYCFSLQV